jgi:hypothetical protein
MADMVPTWCGGAQRLDSDLFYEFYAKTGSHRFIDLTRLTRR